jgi:formylglycine-generating enzyme required for sulfatase activity
MTHPVGEKPANKFGLHDMIGNVYEWTQDCYRDNHVGAPTDGGAVLGQGCPHVVKGGSHYSSAQNLRPADRGRLAPELYDSTLGFRIARSLP